MEVQSQCPNCKSYKVTIWNKKKELSIGVVSLILGVSFFGMIENANTNIVLFPSILLGYGGIIIGLYYLLLGVTRKKDEAICKNCNKKFSPDSVI